MLPASYEAPAAVVLILGGALACFAGFRVFRIVLGIYGFILGALVATSLLAPVQTSTTWLVAIVGGLAGAGILILAYFVGVAFAGAALAALLVHVVWGHWGREPHALVVIGACIAGALLAMALQKAVIILGTAFGGSWTLLAGALAITGQRAVAAAAGKGDHWLTYPLNPVPAHRWVQVAWIVLGAVGALVQWKLSGTRGRPRRTRAKKRRKGGDS
jgi:hypothetical protein